MELLSHVHICAYGMGNHHFCNLFSETSSMRVTTLQIVLEITMKKDCDKVYCVGFYQ